MNIMRDIFGGLLVGFFIGLAIICFLMPANAGGYPPNSEPIQSPVVVLLRERAGCQRGQRRAYFFQDASDPLALCWRARGAVVEILDGNHLITTMPASRFMPVSQGVSQ